MTNEISFQGPSEQVTQLTNQVKPRSKTSFPFDLLSRLDLFRPRLKSGFPPFWVFVIYPPVKESAALKGKTQTKLDALPSVQKMFFNHDYFFLKRHLIYINHTCPL